MRYGVEYRLWANVEVEAESFEEALEKANTKWYYAKFEEESGFSILDGEPCYIASEDGEYEYMD